MPLSDNILQIESRAARALQIISSKTKPKIGRRIVPRKITRCPLCRRELKKINGKKVCPSCGVKVVGDTFRMPPPGRVYGARK
jgi:rRNA maturation endonuclease Nob1